MPIHVKIEIDPWGDKLVQENDSLFSEFGLQHFDDGLLAKVGPASVNFRRKLVFAHRDFDKFVSAAEAGKPVAVMSGIKPSGAFHLGSKMTAEEIIAIQKRFKAKAFYCIADLEAYADNGISLEVGEKIAIDNVADLLALGLDEKNAFIYRQSRCQNVSNLAFLASKKTTLATLEALYGHQNLGLYFSVLTQAGDILQPQLKEFGGPKHVVVPVGLDQDPHIRFTRDVAFKFREEFGFIPPAATFHKTMRSLSGETKMSKRDPLSMLTLSDDLELAKKKVARAFTGGRATAEEQKRLGGEIKKCVVFELMFYHFQPDDAVLSRMSSECVSGTNLCGECKKKYALDVVADYLKKHQEKKKKLAKKAEKLVLGN